MFRRLALLFGWAIACASLCDGAAPSAVPDAGGKWEMSLEVASDGSKVIVARLPADAPIPSGFGQVTPNLIVRYHAGRTAALINFDTFLGSGKLAATVTMGDEPPVEQAWRISADNRGLIVPGDGLAFIEQLKRVETFSVRVAPPKKSPVTATFTTHGVALVMKAMISAGVKYGD